MRGPFSTSAWPRETEMSRMGKTADAASMAAGSIEHLSVETIEEAELGSGAVGSPERAVVDDVLTDSHLLRQLFAGAQLPQDGSCGVLLSSHQSALVAQFEQAGSSVAHKVRERNLMAVLGTEVGKPAWQE